jgi:hypothetical protein
MRTPQGVKPGLVWETQMNRRDAMSAEKGKRTRKPLTGEGSLLHRHESRFSALVASLRFICAPLNCIAWVAEDEKGVLRLLAPGPSGIGAGPSRPQGACD